MTVLASDSSQIEDFYNNAKQNPYTPDLSPRFFDNSLAPIGRGFERGELEIANFFTPEESDNALLIRDAMESAIPDPKITGFLGNTLYGLASAVPALAVGTVASGGNPLGGAALLGGTKGYTRTQELSDKGVSSGVATGLGALEGATQALGAMAPAGIGTTIMSKVLSGAAINTAISQGNRIAAGDVLEANGYADMAKQYKVVDGAGLASDLILGGIFGAMHSHAKTPEERQQNIDANLPSDTDAALAANNIQHLEIDSAPGIPTDIATRNAHVQAMTTATEQLLRGDDVNVSGIINDKNFLPKERNDLIGDAWDRAFKEEGIAPATPELIKAIQGRDAKLIEVQAKHDDVSLRLDQLNTKLDELNTEITRPLNASEQITSVDPMAGQRLQQIERDMQQPNITAQQREALQSEYRLVTEGANYPAKVIKQAAKERMSGLTSQRDSVLGDIAKQQKNLSRYAGEVEKRQARLTEQKAALIPDVSVKLPEETATKIIEGAPKENIINPNDYNRIIEEAGGGKTLDLTGGAIKDAAMIDVTPNVTLAQTIATEKPETAIPMSETETITAQEALAQADNDIAEADSFAKAFSAAVNCFIRNGTE